MDHTDRHRATDPCKADAVQEQYTITAGGIAAPAAGSHSTLNPTQPRIGVETWPYCSSLWCGDEVQVGILRVTGSHVLQLSRASMHR